MTDLEIYIDGFNDKGIQIANAFLDVMRYKLNELGADSTDAFTKIFDTSHIEPKQYYINILLEDLKPIVSDLRNTHMKDSNTASDIDYQSMVISLMILLLQLRLLQRILPKPLMMLILTDSSFCSAKIWK